MFWPSDKFYSNIQQNGVIYESQGVIVHDVTDLEKRKKYALIERSTSNENEYTELQKEICAFDKSDCPYLLKIYRFTYDLVIPESTRIILKDYGTTQQQNLFTRSGSSIKSNTTYGSDYSSNKKIYKLSFLTDYFTTNLKLWIEKKRAEIDKHNSSISQSSIFQKGQIRKGLPQYEFCSLFLQMSEAINHVSQRENKRNHNSFRDFNCKVDISSENFVVNESADLDNKIKFIPMHFLTVYNKNYKKRFTTLIDQQEKYALKRRQTLELQNELIYNGLSTSQNKKSNNGNKSRTLPTISESDFSSIKSGNSTTISSSMTSILSQQEDNESKYLRQLFDLGLKLGALYTGADNFTEPHQQLSQHTKQILFEIYKNYKNVSAVLAQMIESSYQMTNHSSSKKFDLESACQDLRKINELEYHPYDNNIIITGSNQDQNEEWEKFQARFKIATPKKNVSSFQLKRQCSLFNNGLSSQNSFTSISNDLTSTINDENRLKLKSLNSIKSSTSLRKRSIRLSENKIVDSSIQNISSQIEVFDVEQYDKKSKKFKGLSFMIPYTNYLNVIHINQLKNSYIEKIPITQPEKVIIPHEHSTIIAPSIGEFKVFILGGAESNLVYEYDSKFDGILTKKQNMIAARERKNFGFCMFDRDTKIFVATGVKDDQITTQCEMYDIQNDVWKKCSNVNVPLVGSSLCLFNKQFIYKFGGVGTNGKITKIIEKYDIQYDVWRSIQYDIDPNLQQGISFSKNMLSVQINHNQIVIFGGEDSVCNQRHPFYSMIQPNQLPPSNMNHNIFFCHIDRLDHHELFGIQQYGSIPNDAGYLLPGQVSLCENSVVFFQKQLYRQDTGKVMGFSIEKQVHDVRGKDIRY